MDKHKKCCSVEHCSTTSALYVAGLIFGVVSLIHIYRIFKPFPVIFGTYNVPDSASVIVAIIAGLLSVWMIGTGCRRCHLHNKSHSCCCHSSVCNCTNPACGCNSHNDKCNTDKCNVDNR